jgi:hypothetical protein
MQAVNAGALESLAGERGSKWRRSCAPGGGGRARRQVEAVVQADGWRRRHHTLWEDDEERQRTWHCPGTRGQAREEEAM